MIGCEVQRPTAELKVAQVPRVRQLNTLATEHQAANVNAFPSCVKAPLLSRYTVHELHIDLVLLKI